MQESQRYMERTNREKENAPYMAEKNCKGAALARRVTATTQLSKEAIAEEGERLNASIPRDIEQTPTLSSEVQNEGSKLLQQSLYTEPPSPIKLDGKKWSEVLENDALEITCLNKQAEDTLAGAQERELKGGDMEATLAEGAGASQKPVDRVDCEGEDYNGYSAMNSDQAQEEEMGTSARKKIRKFLMDVKNEDKRREEAAGNLDDRVEYARIRIQQDHSEEARLMFEEAITKQRRKEHQEA
ncbi:hypothetical protein R1sor_020748 [Riccia sorocarpa]|uniref:Uncharacterized protein n=1 Tax=Riccia sorocarpa TaxID=122646 RepID=A0ABD3GF24_9MARC